MVEMVAASCGTKDSGSLFAASPLIMAACLTACQDGQDGARGQNRCSAGNSSFFTRQSLDSKYQPKTNRWHCLPGQETRI